MEGKGEGEVLSLTLKEVYLSVTRVSVRAQQRRRASIHRGSQNLRILTRRSLLHHQLPISFLLLVPKEVMELFSVFSRSPPPPSCLCPCLPLDSSLRSPWSSQIPGLARLPPLQLQPSSRTTQTSSTLCSRGSGERCHRQARSMSPSPPPQ